VFWPLYLFLPVNSAVFLWRLRDWQPPEPLIHARAALTVLALLLGGYGLALLAIPERATDFWPWPVDAFHARIYAATYLTPAAGAWVLRSGATPEELRTLGITLVTFGVAALIAVPTNTTFFVINLAPILAGAALLVSEARGSAPAATTA
jgi:hypothetical protein